MHLINPCIEFFQSGGIFMYPLAACSVTLIAVLIYRMINMRQNILAPISLKQKVELYLKGNLKKEELSQSCSKNSVLGRLTLAALNGPIEAEETLKDSVQANAREEFTELQSGIPLLDMIVMIAPMFGILGTAAGLSEVFRVFGTDEQNGQIAAGIAQALNTTIAGLAIAVPAVMAQVYYTRKLERLSVTLEVLLSGIISYRKTNQD